MTINVVRSVHMLQVPVNLLFAIYFVVKLITIICIIICLIITNKAIADAPTIILASDYRCPYSCDPHDQNPGYLVEIAQKIFNIYGIRVEYKLMPWSDALKAVEDGEIDGIIGINDIEGRDLLIPHVPQAFSVTSVFARIDTDWIYDEPESLIGKKIAMVQDYNINNPAIQQYITTNYLRDPWSFIVESGVNAVVDSVNTVVDKTSDIYIGCQEVVNYYLNLNNIAKQIKNCGQVTQHSIPLYIAFSASSPKAEEYIKMLEEGMTSIQAIGDLANLKNKYQITQ